MEDRKPPDRSTGDGDGGRGDDGTRDGRDGEDGRNGREGTTPPDDGAIRPPVGEQPPPGTHLGDGGEHDLETPIIPPRVSVRRPDDLLVLDLTFGGLVFKTNPPRLERAESDAYIVIEFPPQSFGEEAYLESQSQKFEPAAEQTEVSNDPSYPKKNVAGRDENSPAKLPAARVRMSQPSRVGVTMPVGLNTIGYDLPSVLSALRDWPMRLDANAVPDPPSIQLQRFSDVTHATAVRTAAQPIEGVAISPAPSTVGEHLAARSELTLISRLFGPHQPGSTITALELPYRIVTSPIEDARWQHAHDAVAHHGRTELWHTRLTTSKSAVGADQASRIRALWSPDYRPAAEIDQLIKLISAPTAPPEEPKPNPDLIRMSLDPLDRSMLVTLMAGFDSTVESGAAYKPISSEAKRLHLSALGALLDAEGTWTTTPEHVDLEQWRHLSTLGRDHYVRVMYKGYLCPFGHPASLVKVTERKFESLAGNFSQRTALLRQRFFIVVREPVLAYNGTHHTHGGRDFPFTRVEILTRVTPDLGEPGEGASALKTGPGVAGLYDGLAHRMLFWPMVPPGATTPTDFRFEIAATDLAGNRVTFSMPLLFVGKLADADRSVELRKSYNAAPADPKRRTSLGGAAVSFAPSSPTDKGDPKLPTKTITFRVGDLTPKGKPNLYPEIELAEVGIKPIQKLLSQPNFVTEVAYPDFYIASGFNAPANAGQVFLKLTSAKRLTFGGAGPQAKSDSLGALASPQMSLLGLSKVMGPVAGRDATDGAQVEDALKTVKGGEFNPADFFKDATLLGGIKIGEILKSTHDLSGAAAPKMLARDFPDRVESSFEWDTDVTEIDKLKLLVPQADKGKPPTRLTMSGVVRTPLDPAMSPTVNAQATITNFKVNLFGFIILWFEELVFTSKNGQKPDVTVRLRDGDDAVLFGGPLEFVNDLRKFIPGNGFSDPPSLAVTPSGISAGYSLTLPAIGIGVFALSNASLGAAFNLPFDSKPASVKFNFSKRDAPFSLTVSLLGGGGFFAIGVSARGVNEIEAALEFGAAIAIDLGVASGSVEVKAGIYFHWLEPVPDKGSVELAGYVRIHGELTVIAIISVSLTFNLQLGYLKEDGKSTVYGEATLTVEIEILMFSAEVSVKCRREFAGGEADPKFIDLISTPQIWANYCDAFAEEVD
jgi:hypothetical protein